MPTSSDLMGGGNNPLLAGMLGNDPQALTTTGTAQTTAAAIRSHLVTLTTASSQTGAILPAARVGTPFYVSNPAATTGLVYCPVGHTMNGSSNGSVSLAQNKAAIIIQTAKGVWVSILTA